MAVGVLINSADLNVSVMEPATQDIYVKIILTNVLRAHVKMKPDVKTK